MADNTDRSGAVARIMALTNCDSVQAEWLLEACGNNEELAVQMYFDQQPSQPEPSLQDRANLTDLPPRPPAPAVRGTARHAPAGTSSHAQPQGHARQPGGLVGALVVTAFRIPFFLIRTSFGIMATTITLGLGVAGFVGDRVLPAPVMRTVRGAVAAIAGRNDLEPPAQAQLFIQQFTDAYGQRHPNWQPTELQAACVAARSQHKFLMVYLHSPEHEDTDAFCSQVLCEPELVAYANQQYVCWGGDIRQSDAHALSLRLGATTYPFIAVLSLAHNNKATLLQASQGRSLLVPGALLRVLQHCLQEQGAILVAQRAEVQEREINRQLMAEQNAEFEASLAADREREAQREAERRQREEAARQQAEAEARERAEQEAAERRVREREAAIASRRATKRAALVPEAAAGAAGAALVRVRLPDGSNAQRSFPDGCCISALFDFVDSLDSTNYLQYNLVSNYPRKVFTQEPSSMNVSLADAGLVPHAALFVQPLDEDPTPPA